MRRGIPPRSDTVMLQACRDVNSIPRARSRHAGEGRGAVRRARGCAKRSELSVSRDAGGGSELLAGGDDCRQESIEPSGTRTV
jgi:hypothetical protein